MCFSHIFLQYFCLSQIPPYYIQYYWRNSLGYENLQAKQLFFVTTISATLMNKGWLNKKHGALYLVLLIRVDYILLSPLVFKSICGKIVIKVFGEYFFFRRNSLHESFLIGSWFSSFSSLIYSCKIPLNTYIQYFFIYWYSLVKICYRYKHSFQKWPNTD